MRDVSLLLSVSISNGNSSSLMKEDDKAEGVEYLETVAASSMRFWMEASFLRY